MVKKINYVITTVLFLSICFLSFGQNEHIQFHNEFEENVLNNIERHSEIEILLAISENSSYTLVEKVNAQIAELKIELSKKKFDKKEKTKS